MATQVDPPENFVDKFKEGERWTNEDGTLTEIARYHLNSQFRFDYDLWERTGGSDDTVSDLESNNIGDNALLAQVANLHKRIDELESQNQNFSELAIILQRLDELSSKANSRSGIYDQRISDLELQQ